MTFEFNKDDPGLQRAREIAHARKLDQDSFSDLLGVYAGQKIAEAQMVNDARTAELAKLGSAAPQRIGAVQTWTQAKLPPDQAAAIDQMLVTAKHVEAFESLIRLFSNQGAAGFDQRARATETEQGKIPGYDNMSFRERRLAQMGQKAAGGGR